MNRIITTSLSLPRHLADFWRKDQKQIMHMAERFLRIMMRNVPSRGRSRQYNESGHDYEIVTTRFESEEYDTLHYVAAALRISVSLLVCGIIKLWLKPVRRKQKRKYLTNYSWQSTKWDPEAGFIEEYLTIWRSPPPLPLLQNRFQ